MKNTLIIFAGVAVIAALGYTLFFKKPALTNYPPRQGPIVAFGDSLVQGVGSSQEGGFVSRVSTSINEPIENMGRSGDTTAQALERLPEVVARHPSIAIVLLGGNDYLRRVPKETTFANLRTIVTTLQADGALVVLLGVRGGVLSDNFKGEFDSLARETGSAYVSDVLQNLLGNKQYMFDEIHPNDQGYAAIAERVTKVLRPLLQ